jgi:hypothetical protein
MPVDKSVPDENLEPSEYIPTGNACIYCGHKKCVCDDRYEDYVEKQRK